MQSRRFFCIFIVCSLLPCICASNDDYLSKPSIRRQQFEMEGGIERVRCGFEPILSIGNYFFGRYNDVSFRSTVLPYTKNSTIVSTGVFSFLIGILFGVVLTIYCSLRRSQRTPVKEEDEVCFGPLSEDDDQARSPNLDVDDDEFLEKSLSLESWTLVDDPVANRLAKKDIKKETESSNDQIKVLCKSMEDLNVTLKSVVRPMTAIQENTETIAGHIGLVSSLTHWMAGRKSKKDMWLSTMDSLSCGVIVMNVTLALSSWYFGRWQDWGVDCEPLFSTYETKVIFGKIWCYAKEPYGFLLGCILWFFSIKCLSASGFLRKREALPTLLLILSLVLAGVLHSTVVSLLGGTFNTAFYTWLIYGGFLVRSLEYAKVRPLQKEKANVNRFGLLSFLFGGNHLMTTVSVLIFPVLVSVLPFWNKGLSLWMYYALNEQWNGALATLHHLYIKLYEFGLY